MVMAISLSTAMYQAKHNDALLSKKVGVPDFRHEVL